MTSHRSPEYNEQANTAPYGDDYVGRHGLEQQQPRRSEPLGRVSDRLAWMAVNGPTGQPGELPELSRATLPYIALLGPIAQQVEVYTTHDLSHDLDRSRPLFEDNVVRAAFGSRAPYMGSLLAIIPRADTADRSVYLDTYIFALAPGSYGRSAADGPLLMFANGNQVGQMLANNNGVGLAQPVPDEDMRILGCDDVEFIGEKYGFGVYVFEDGLPTVIDMSGKGITVISRKAGLPVPTPYLESDVQTVPASSWLNGPRSLDGTVTYDSASLERQRRPDDTIPFPHII